MQITNNFAIMRVKLNCITGKDGVYICINTYFYMCVCTFRCTNMYTYTYVIYMHVIFIFFNSP